MRARPTLDRRGVAMMAALWLVVAIAVVALQLSLVAKERRVLGLAAADRGIGRGAALGALALTQARLDAALRNAPTGQAANALANSRSADPWLAVDSIYSGTVYVDSTATMVLAEDLGTRLTINPRSEQQLRDFFSYVTGNFSLADQLSQTIADWRDLDDNKRPAGEERDGYLKKGLLAIPTNGPFRRVEELLMVEGMTPELFQVVRPYLTTYGNGTVNLNSAPVPVLRALPGMSDAVLNNILSMRSNGQRISSVNSVVPGAVTGGGRGGGGISPQATQLAASAGVNTTNVALTIVVRPSAASQPVKLTALLQRNGTTATVGWIQW
jgi:type II secretory pathway component PulK